MRILFARVILNSYTIVFIAARYGENLKDMQYFKAKLHGISDDEYEQTVKFMKEVMNLTYNTKDKDAYFRWLQKEIETCPIEISNYDRLRWVEVSKPY